MQNPGECESMQEVSSAIDLLDRRIILLIGIRFQYVKGVNGHKKKDWTHAIERMYSDVVNHFIAAELEFWNKRDGERPR